LGGGSAREFYLAETLSYNRNLDLFREENMVFLENKFLMQGDRGKSEIKNYRSDQHEFRDFL
jgi:hypothetical protein